MIKKRIEDLDKTINKKDIAEQLDHSLVGKGLDIVGIGLNDNGIVVLISDKAIEPKIPKKFKGIDVSVEVVGKIEFA